MSGIFDDIISKEEKQKAQSKLYLTYESINNLRSNVGDSKVGLEDLISSIKVAQLSYEQSNDKDNLKNIKEEMDKVAFLLEKFINEFKPIYEDASTRYTTEVLAGSYEPKGSTITGRTITLGSDVIGSASFDGALQIRTSELPKKPGWNKN